MSMPAAELKKKLETIATTDQSSAHRASASATNVSLEVQIAELSKKLATLELILKANSDPRVTWDHTVIAQGDEIVQTQFGGSYSGIAYKTEVQKGTLAIYMENGGTAKPGTMKIGVRVKKEDTEILTLARMHKTEGYDFFIKSADFDKKTEVSIVYAVVKTPLGYNENSDPALGYPKVRTPFVLVNCKDTDKWIEPKTNLLERTHPERNAPLEMSWDHSMLSGSAVGTPIRQYPGTFYRTVAKGLFAIHMENGNSEKPGTMKIGLKQIDKEGKEGTEILTLARMHKTEGHAFYLNKMEPKDKEGNAFIEYGVVQTPPNYQDGSDPILGYPRVDAPLVAVNCGSSDSWVEPQTNLLERTHSPRSKAASRSKS